VFELRTRVAEPRCEALLAGSPAKSHNASWKEFPVAVNISQRDVWSRLRFCSNGRQLGDCREGLFLRVHNREPTQRAPLAAKSPSLRAAVVSRADRKAGGQLAIRATGRPSRSSNTAQGDIDHLTRVPCRIGVLTLFNMACARMVYNWPDWRKVE
jgi:hypothetical protein